MNNLDLSLYLVTNNSEDEEKFLNIIEESLKGGVSVVQLREKKAETLDFYNLALKVKEITQKYNVPLIIKLLMLTECMLGKATCLQKQQGQ